MLNPVIVEGQLHGGIAQGIGEALYEHVHYDTEGGLVTGSLMDFAVPSAAMIPRLDLTRTETLSPRNPLEMKSIGESGTMSAPPAVANAVLDALWPEGVLDLELPMIADRIWYALHSTRRD